MSLGLLKKEIYLIIRNKHAYVTIISIAVLEIILIIYSRTVIGTERVGTGNQFNYMQNYILIFFFPVITANILLIAFSLTKEKSCFMLAKLIPFGEITFLRSKVNAAVVLAAILGFSWLFSGVYFCGLELFQNLNFLIATSFYLLFCVIGLSSFSISYAVNYFECKNNYEPDVKGIIGLMFFISLFTVASFLIYSQKLRFYYEYVIGLEHDYPNREFIELICIGFIFLVISRFLLNMTEKRLQRE